MDDGSTVKILAAAARNERIRPTTIGDPVLVRFHAELDKIYGDQIERVVLFGSRARGDDGPESDYDVAIFIKQWQDRWQEMDRLVPVVTDILYDLDAFIHALPFGEGAYQTHTPLMHEIRREGIDF